METFPVFLALCDGKPRGITSQRDSNEGFDIFVDFSLRKGWINIRVVGDLGRYVLDVISL